MCTGGMHLKYVQLGTRQINPTGNFPSREWVSKLGTCYNRTVCVYFAAPEIRVHLSRVYLSTKRRRASWIVCAMPRNNEFSNFLSLTISPVSRDPRPMRRFDIILKDRFAFVLRYILPSTDLHMELFHAGNVEYRWEMLKGKSRGRNADWYLSNLLICI